MLVGDPPFTSGARAAGDPGEDRHRATRTLSRSTAGRSPRTWMRRSGRRWRRCRRIGSRALRTSRGRSQIVASGTGRGLRLSSRSRLGIWAAIAGWCIACLLTSLLPGRSHRPARAIPVRGSRFEKRSPDDNQGSPARVSDFGLIHGTKILRSVADRGTGENRYLRLGPLEAEAMRSVEVRGGRSHSSFGVSPDGTSIAFVAGNRLRSCTRRIASDR